MDPSDPAFAGQADYNPFLLKIYDPFVIGFMTRAVWRIPIAPVMDMYRRNLSGRHLDVGPGTGYFIDETGLPPGGAVTLLDPNPNVLAHASRRLDRMDPAVVESDVLKPLPVKGPFDSVALNFVLHCLPGPQSAKAAAIRNCAAVLEPDGTLFGGTVLGTGGKHTPQARAVLWAFNRHGGFDNLGDTAAGLEEILEGSFSSVEVDVVGSVALFEARGPDQRAAVPGDAVPSE